MKGIGLDIVNDACLTATREFVVDDAVYVGKRKVPLNLNDYRNCHHQTLNRAKIKFKEFLYAEYPELYEIKAQGMVVSYDIRPVDRRMFDTMNIISVVDKFFLDALVDMGTLPDDNYQCVKYGIIKTSDPAKKSKTDRYKKIVIKCEFLLYNT